MVNIKNLLHQASASKPRDSIWELTSDYSPLPHFDDVALPSPLYEVGISGEFTPTSPDVFDAWTGLRRLNGEPYHGPVYNFGTSTPYEGPRSCSCHLCEAGAQAIHKKN
jgi:hypothetical protein